MPVAGVAAGDDDPPAGAGVPFTGACAVADAAFALEKQARTGEVGDAESLLESLIGEINRLLPEIELFCRKVAP